MKKRKGFVANSSTASFVLVGFDGSNLFSDLEDVWNIESKVKFDSLYEGEGGAPEGVALVIGRYVAHMSSDDYEPCEMVDFEELMEDVKRIQKELGAEHKKIQFWKGTMMS